MLMVSRPGKDYVAITTPFYCLDESGRLLMHRRGKACRDEHGRWDTGSGKLEVGLDFEENVLKEVQEEYGCVGVIIDSCPMHHIRRELDGEMSHWLAVPFFVRVNPDMVRIMEPDKMSEIGWFRLDSLPSPLHTGFNYTLNHYYLKFFDHMVPK
jgi:8-oxo-dGTP diphosphatase